VLRRRDGTGGGVGVVVVVAAMVELRGGFRRWWMGWRFGLFTESRGSEIWVAVELISDCSTNRRSRVDDFLAMETTSYNYGL
jgi:hypothetical protein